MNRSQYWQFPKTLWRSKLLGLAAVGFLAACGGGSGSGGVGSASTDTAASASSSAAAATSNAAPQSCSDCGTAMVSLTDAAGDFDSYIVNVDSLKLTRSDGTVIETVPVATQVDFAQLVDLSEIISAQQIPSGTYVSATMTVDFAGATLVVDNGTSGVTIAADQILNGSTTPAQPLVAPNPTQMTFTVSLGADNRLVISQGAIANLALDFNLAASNVVTPSATSPTTVTVNPVLSASLVPDATKTLRVRGSLVSVNDTAGNSSYVVNVRPFNDASNTSGQVTIDTTSTTSYLINGTSYTGSAGLAQVATLPAGTVTAAVGSWNPSTKSFTATNVQAGASVVGIGHDGVEGTVLARSGNTLTIADGLVFRVGAGGMGFEREVTATVGPNTAVAELGQPGPFTIANISVGQHIQLSGSLSMGTMQPMGSSTSMSSSSTSSSSSTAGVTLDATAGAALLTPTLAQGEVSLIGTNLVTVNLQALDGRPASSFNFAGTGASGQDATAAAYTISTPAAVSLSALGVGAPASFIGFVSPFGQAPPDFAASTLISFAQARTLALVRWSASTNLTAPFATLNGSEVLLSQTVLKEASLSLVRQGPAPIDLSALTGGLQIVPDASATNLRFAIAHAKTGTSDNFSTFADFETALTTDLNGTVALLQLYVDGTFNATTGVLTADQMLVVLND